MSAVLVLSPHPDDEAIGCGGTLRCHVEGNDRVHVVFLTSGEGGGHGRSPEETARLRESEAAASARILGIDGFDFWRLPDGRLRADTALVVKLQRELELRSIDVLYAPHPGEAHPDHRAAARLAARAVGAGSNNLSGVSLLLYEVWTPLQRIHHIVDISAQVAVKRRAIRAHRSQCEVMRFDEAALALNRYRGEMHSWPGGPHAEVFARHRV